MLTERKVFIQHPCQFTQEGIGITLMELMDNNINIINEASLTPITYNLLYRDNVDIDVFILGLGAYGDNYGCILDLVINWLPTHYPRAKVVIMGGGHTMGAIRNYFLGLSNVTAVLDNAIKIHDLKRLLKDIMMNSNCSEPTKKVTPLTHQEIKVIGYLLKGVPPLKIANALHINQKTVSSHKMSALKKLGVKSLYSLMKFNFDFSVISEFISVNNHAVTC